MRNWILVGFSLCCISLPSRASETVTFSYDALGRLMSRSSSGTVNNGLVQSDIFTPADDRSSYKIEGSLNRRKIVVGKLKHGYVVVPIRDHTEW